MNYKVKLGIFSTLLTTFILYSCYLYFKPYPTGNNILLTENARQGKLVFQNYNCIACHQIYGLGGYMGPDLTNVISKNSKQYAEVFIRNGTTKMPNFNLNETEIEQLLSYLSYVDKTGISPAKGFTINIDGSVNFDEQK